MKTTLFSPTALSFYTERYVIGRQIATDKSSDTYHTYDRETKRHVAAHILKPHLYDHIAHRQFAYTRLRSRAQIIHPNLVPIYDVGIAVDQLIWITPLLEETIPLTHLNYGTLSDEHILSVVRQTGRALTHLHINQFMHGALSPKRLLWNKQGRLQLSGCVLVDGYDQFGSDAEPLLYLSPEQVLQQRPIASPSADIYALGILLYQMIEGKFPFCDSTDPSTIISFYLDGTFPPLTSASSRHWQQPLADMTQRDPEARHFSLPDRKQVAQSTDAESRYRPTLQGVVDLLPGGRAIVNGITPRQHLFQAMHQMHKRRVFAYAMAVLCIFSLVFMRYGAVIGAYGATVLRAVVGNEVVATMEEAVFTVQDRVEQTGYQVGLKQPQAPWEVDTFLTHITPVSRPAVATPQPQPQPEPNPDNDDETVGLSLPEVSDNQASRSAWEQLSALEPLGSLETEGHWQAYMYNPDGSVVAQRTFLQPDPDRPTTIVAIVAFDLTRTRLRYVLGTEEPGTGGSGTIPAYHKIPGTLLSTFNGGFMATHGRFGAMSNGHVAVPPLPGLATVTIGEDGDVNIGEWGHDIEQTADDRVAYRQNARLVVKQGAVNYAVYSNAVSDWGGTINNSVVTWRSALGLSEDRTVLYYLAGSGLNMPVLADAGLHIGIYNLMLLDINAYWVHFAAVHGTGDGRLTTSPLFEEGMSVQSDRYLNESARDFFYVTTPP